jgi:hypothetical protein
VADREDDVSRVDVADVASPGPANGHGTPEPVDAPQCYYQSLGEFAGWLLAVYRRSTRGQARVFCPQWWKHPEAVVRMDSLWRAFEQLRQDPGTGLSVFWRDHVDHHMTVLLDADGPFKGCEDGHCEHPLGPLVQQQPPAVLFTRDERGLPPFGAEPGPALPRIPGAAAAGAVQITIRKP